MLSIPQAAARLTPLDESPRIGLQALRALARWLGNRDGRRQSADPRPVGHAATNTAAEARTSVQGHGSASNPVCTDRRGDA